MRKLILVWLIAGCLPTFGHAGTPAYGFDPDNISNGSPKEFIGASNEIKTPGIFKTAAVEKKSDESTIALKTGWTCLATCQSISKTKSLDTVGIMTKQYQDHYTLIWSEDVTSSGETEELAQRSLEDKCNKLPGKRAESAYKPYLEDGPFSYQRRYEPFRQLAQNKSGKYCEKIDNSTELLKLLQETLDQNHKLADQLKQKR